MKPIPERTGVVACTPALCLDQMAESSLALLLTSVSRYCHPLLVTRGSAKVGDFRMTLVLFLLIIVGAVAKIPQIDVLPHTDTTP